MAVLRDHRIPSPQSIIEGWISGTLPPSGHHSWGVRGHAQFSGLPPLPSGLVGHYSSRARVGVGWGPERLKPAVISES